MSSENGVDQATEFWMDRGGEEPTVEAWKDTRERVNADPDRDDWKSRDNEDREQAVVAAVDEVKNRDRDDEEWGRAKETHDWIHEARRQARRVD